MSSTVVFEGLPEGTQESQLRKYLGELGKHDTLISVLMGKDPFTEKPTGSAKVTFSDSDIAEQVVTEFNLKEFEGNQIGLKLAAPQVTQLKKNSSDRIGTETDNAASMTSSIEKGPKKDTLQSGKILPTTTFQPPKISIFSGDPKLKPGESKFEGWKYEVTCLLKEGAYSREILTPIIRRSLRGEAGEVARYMGPDAPIEDIVDKLEGLFGTVESGAVLLQQLYVSRQEQEETAAAFGLRVELLANKAKERGGLSPAVLDSTMRTVFWQGLVDKELKNVVRHKMDIVKSFDELIRVVRVAEQETRESAKFHESGSTAPKSKTKNAQSYAAQGTPTQKGASENEILYKKFENRLAQLETKLDDMMTLHSQRTPDKQRQPITCYKCGKEGHIVRYCRNDPTPEWLARHLNGRGTLQGGNQ